MARYMEERERELLTNEELRLAAGMRATADGWYPVSIRFSALTANKIVVLLAERRVVDDNGNPTGPSRLWADDDGEIEGER